MFDLIDNYIEELFEDSDFKRLLELKKYIDSNYAGLIMAFKTNEDKYNELKSYGSYAIGLSDAKKRFMESKRKLYSIPEVVEYFTLERKIQARLSDDINAVKMGISNKFKVHNSFKI